MSPLGDLLAVLAVGLASALLPVVNIETYLGVRASVGEVSHIWSLGLVAAVGQMMGKVIWYLLGARSLHWGWVRRRLDTPKARDRLGRWRSRIHDRPVLAGGLVLVSAFSGVPPLAVLAVVAGQLRMSLWVFCSLGLLGRWLRFAGVLGGADWLSGLLH